MNTTTMTRATVCRAVLAKRSGSSASSFLRSSTPFKAAVAPRLTFNPTNDASNSRTVQVQANLFSRFGRVVKSYGKVVAEALASEPAAGACPSTCSVAALTHICYSMGPLGCSQRADQPCGGPGEDAGSDGQRDD
eukprot:scaffold549_cov385-Prasinococcus_capsulatus_cf.AAC.24